MLHYSQIEYIDSSGRKVFLDISLERAIFLLENQIEDPSYLIALWRFSGRCHADIPYPEKCNPWYEGIEELIVKR